MSSHKVNIPLRLPRATSAGAMPIPMHQRMMVGSIAGVVGTSIIFPVDTVKTRVQASNLRTGVYRTIRSMLGKEGMLGFYRGLLPALIGTGPEKAVKLAVNDVARSWLSPNASEITGTQQVLAGAIAGVSQACVSTPNEMVKLRMQLMEAEVARGMPRMNTLQVIRELGFRGMFRGFGATLARDLPYNVVFFPLYSTTKAWLCADGVETTPKLVASGATAGMVAAWLGTPMDMVKTRLQARGSVHTGVVDCIRNVYKAEGVSAFFKGSINRMAVQAPMYAIVMAAFELQKAYLASRQEEEYPLA